MNAALGGGGGVSSPTFSRSSTNTIELVLESTLGPVTLNVASATVVDFDANSKTPAVTLTGALAPDAEVTINRPAGTLSLSGATFNSAELTISTGSIGTTLTLANGLKSLTLSNVTGLTTFVTAASNIPGTITATGLSTLTTFTNGGATARIGDVGTWDFSGCALSSGSVAAILALGATLAAVGFVIQIHGGTNAAPAGGVTVEDAEVTFECGAAVIAESDPPTTITALGHTFWFNFNNQNSAPTGTNPAFPLFEVGVSAGYNGNDLATALCSTANATGVIDASPDGTNAVLTRGAYRAAAPDGGGVFSTTNINAGNGANASINTITAASGRVSHN